MLATKTQSQPASLALMSVRDNAPVMASRCGTSVSISGFDGLQGQGAPAGATGVDVTRVRVVDAEGHPPRGDSDC